MALNLGFIGKKIDQFLPGNQSFLHPNDRPQPRPTGTINAINQATGGSPVQRAQAAPLGNNGNTNYVNPLTAVPKAIANVPIQMVKNTAELGANAVAAPIEQGISLFEKDPATRAAIQADAARRSPIAQAGQPLSRAFAGEDVGSNLLKSVGSTVNTVSTALPLVGFGKRQAGEAVGKAVVRSAGQNALLGGVIGASGAAASTGDVKQTLKGGAEGAAIGGVLGAGGEALGQGAVKGFQGAKPIIDKAPSLNERGSIPLPGKATVTLKETPKATVTPKEIVPNTPKVDVPEPVVAPTKQDSFTNQLGEAMTTKNKVIYKELKNIENQTGQTGLQDKFAYQAGLQARSNSIAAGKLADSPHFQQAVGGLGRKQIGEFNDYAAARRELANAADGLPVSQPIDKLKKTVQMHDEAYAPRFAALNNYYKGLATDLHQAGIIDTAQHENFLSDPNYVRVQRNMDELVNQRGAGGKAMSLGSTSAAQKRTGSTREVQPILETAAQRTQQVQNEIQRNETAKFLTDTLEKAGQATKLDNAAAARNKNVLKRFVDGKVEYYQVSPDIKRVAEQISPFQLNALQQIIAAPGRVFRAGTTGLRAPFTVANYLKDQQGSAVYSKNVMATHNPVAILSGLKDATKAQFGHVDDPLWDKFIAHAGDQTSYDMTRNIRGTTEQVQKIAGVKGGGVTRSVLHPIRTLEDLNSITEKATRFQNFKGIYNDAIKKGATEGEALQEATLAAWRNSIDFQEAGSWARAINLVIPYFNPAIQGSRQLQRSFRERPVATSFKTITSLGIPMAAATVWNTSDDERKKVYDNISDFEKQNSIVLVPPGTSQNADGSYNVIKIPLEPGLGSLIQPIRRGIESSVNQTGQDVKGIAGDLFKSVSGPINPGTPEQIFGSITPQALKPAIQQVANKDFFTGKSIVPDYLNKGVDENGNPLSEADKKYSFTSGTADVVGGILGVSPIRVQKFVSDTLGKVGDYALNASDHILADTGVISADQIGGTSVGQDFIRRFGEASGKYNYNKSAGAKYFEDLTQISDSIKDPKDKALFTAIHAKNPSPGIFDSAEKAALYINHPDLLTADAALNDAAVRRGQASNPFFKLTPDQQQAVLLMRVGKFLPGQTYDKAGGSLFADTGAGKFYSQYTKDESAYYDAIQAEQDKTAAETGKPKKQIDRPTLVAGDAPKIDQGKLDYYESLPKGTGARSSFLNANPDVVQYFKDSADYTNQKREAVGLAPVDTSSNSSSGKSKVAYRGGGGGSSAQSSYSAKLARTPFKKATKAKLSLKKGSAGKAKVAVKGSKAKVSSKKSLV